MKKAKIFLTVLAVLAIVGGAVAFKTKTPKSLCMCDTTSLRCILDCSMLTTYKTTAPSAQGIIYSAGKFNDGCVFANNTWTCTTKITVDPEE